MNPASFTLSGEKGLSPKCSSPKKIKRKESILLVSKAKNWWDPSQFQTYNHEIMYCLTLKVAPIFFSRRLEHGMLPYLFCAFREKWSCFIPPVPLKLDFTSRCRDFIRECWLFLMKSMTKHRRMIAFCTTFVYPIQISGWAGRWLLQFFSLTSLLLLCPLSHIFPRLFILVTTCE